MRTGTGACSAARGGAAGAAGGGGAGAAAGGGAGCGAAAAARLGRRLRWLLLTLALLLLRLGVNRPGRDRRERQYQRKGSAKSLQHATTFLNAPNRRVRNSV